MKLISPIFILLILLTSSSLWATTGYDISINDQGYDLKIEMNFSGHQSMQSLRYAFTSGQVISELSPNVESVSYSASAPEYQALMVVKSFGIKSELLSKCSEVFSEKEWSRTCKLQTDFLDGGKFMVSKSDQVICKKQNEQLATCSFSILGKTRPLKLLGFQILNARSFAVKAKVQALNNFFKLYFFINDHNLSTKRALQFFEHSVIKRSIDEFDREATKILKKEKAYNRSFRLPENR